MSFDFNDTDRITTNNGLILEVTAVVHGVDTALLGVPAIEEDFIFARAVGRVSGDNSDLPRNVFVFRASDGRRFRQQAEDSGLNIQGAYVAPAPAVTAQAVTETTASAWQVPAPATTYASAGPIPPANAPSVGDRAETRLGLVLEVTSVDFDADTGAWVVSSRAIGRTENSNPTNRGRSLPRNVFHHSLAGVRVDDVRDADLTRIVRGLDPDAPIAFDEDLTAVDEQPAVPASAVLGDNLPR